MKSPGTPPSAVGPWADAPWICRQTSRGCGINRCDFGKGHRIARHRIGEDCRSHLRKLLPIDDANDREVLLQVIVRWQGRVRRRQNELREVGVGVLCEQLVQVAAGEASPKNAELRHLRPVVEAKHGVAVPKAQILICQGRALRPCQGLVIHSADRGVEFGVDHGQDALAGIAGVSAQLFARGQPQGGCHRPPARFRRAVLLGHRQGGRLGHVGKRRDHGPLVLGNQFVIENFLQERQNLSALVAAAHWP